MGVEQFKFWIGLAVGVLLTRVFSEGQRTPAHENIGISRAAAAVTSKPPALGRVKLTRDLSLDTTCISGKAAGAFKRTYETGGFTAGRLKLADRNASYYYGYGKGRNPGSLSGAGSHLGSNTVNSINFLAAFIREVNATSIVDIPCGDVNWQFDSWEMDSIPVYVGLDVAADVIRMDQQRFAHHRNKGFAAWDFAECPLPKYVATIDGVEVRPTPFQVVHVRDVIQHLPLNDGLKAVRNVFASGCEYAVMTTMPETPDGNKRGKNMPHSSYYGAQLGSPPFDAIVPKPVRCFETHPHHEKDLTCLYRCADTPKKPQ
eukprot:m.167630 g.167630  ORF g.167630 m.167630 type:complete len:316 (+) comp14736_c0_seq2:79-1026(+)